MKRYIFISNADVGPKLIIQVLLGIISDSMRNFGLRLKDCFRTHTFLLKTKKPRLAKSLDTQMMHQETIARF